MGLDGFSMGNLGLNAELTSIQMASQMEQLAQKGSEFKIKDVTESAEKDSIKQKEEDDAKNQFNDGFTENKNNEDENKNALVEDIETKDPKEFSVRINPETELIELFNSKDEQVLETISATDLMQVVSKLDGASGILVNRKI